MYRSFANSPLQASVLGLGAAALGGDLFHVDEKEALRTLAIGVERGINFFDTADIYQMGVSERLIGRAFKRHRQSLFIATKGGARFTPLGNAALRLRPSLRPAASLLKPIKRRLLRAKNSQRRTDFSDGHLTDALHASLARLETDYVDLYQLHHPDSDTLRRYDYQATLGRLKREGKIRFIGVSCDSVEDALLALSNPELDAIQLKISMLDQGAISAFVPESNRRGVAVIARQPLGRGLLTDARSETKAERLESGKVGYDQRIAHARALRFLVNDRRTMAQAAIRYLLQVPGISLVLTGMSNLDHLQENLGALNAPELSEQEMGRVQLTSKRFSVDSSANSAA
jgi:aryl-alcohol dehydrogenase-like predicted oxidoreductase